MRQPSIRKPIRKRASSQRENSCVRSAVWRQAEDVGSIPITRSKIKLGIHNFVSKLYITISCNIQIVRWHGYSVMLVVSYNQFIANGILIKTYSAFKLNVPRCQYCWYLIKYLIKLKHMFKKLMVPRVFSTSFHSFLDIITYESHNSKFSSIVYWNNIRLLNQLY